MVNIRLILLVRCIRHGSVAVTNKYKPSSRRGSWAYLFMKLEIAPVEEIDRQTDHRYCIDGGVDHHQWARSGDGRKWGEAENCCQR